MCLHLIKVISDFHIDQSKRHSLLHLNPLHHLTHMSSPSCSGTLDHSSRHTPDYLPPSPPTLLLFLWFLPLIHLTAHCGSSPGLHLGLSSCPTHILQLYHKSFVFKYHKYANDLHIYASGPDLSLELQACIHIQLSIWQLHLDNSQTSETSMHKM